MKHRRTHIPWPKPFNLDKAVLRYSVPDWSLNELVNEHALPDGQSVLPPVDISNQPYRTSGLRVPATDHKCVDD